MTLLRYVNIMSMKMPSFEASFKTQARNLFRGIIVELLFARDQCMVFVWRLFICLFVCLVLLSLICSLHLICLQVLENAILMIQRAPQLNIQDVNLSEVRWNYYIPFQFPPLFRSCQQTRRNQIFKPLFNFITFFFFNQVIAIFKMNVVD